MLGERFALARRLQTFQYLAHAVSVVDALLAPRRAPRPLHMQPATAAPAHLPVGKRVGAAVAGALTFTWSTAWHSGTLARGRAQNADGGSP